MEPRRGAGAEVEGALASGAIDWDGEIRAHGQRVLISLLALGLPLDVAEDVADQAWMKLIEKHGRGELGEVRLPGLAIVQARFLALNALKQADRERRRSVEVDERLAIGEDLAASPEARAAARERLARALAVLEGCSDSARAVFVQVYEDPAPSHEVVAARVGLSVQRVRQILCEVRKKMREAMEGGA